MRNRERERSMRKKAREVESMRKYSERRRDNVNERVRKIVKERERQCEEERV